MKNADADIINVFGMNVFGDTVMRQRLPRNVYEQLKEIIRGHRKLDANIAEIVANAMKDWAIEKGATHYTHWFQPLTGITAEKHESFISPNGDGGIIMEFSGKELVQGEPDASSFPSGGLRATFEARGYTVWDVTSPAFIKDDQNGKTLYIPTAFYSYNGEALDKKTPLLRSIEALSGKVIRVLRLLGNTTSQYAFPCVGPEQEYFLIDEAYYNQRLDLQMTGRTLFGAPASKGHELDDHYFGSIKERVSRFMNDLDMELWKLGVSAKTKHNEVAPNQYEMAVIYGDCNVIIDQNHLVMETMRRVARQHKLVCLLHEKPFARINGSGKHNNWSVSTDDGINLLSPGNNRKENTRFLLFLSAVIKAVDEHADLLRLAASTPGNDHRLGGNEAPPSVISIFLGKTLTRVLENIASGKPNGERKKEVFKLGVSALPEIPKDDTDRNRTSPFAFTLNKFEFRMVSSQASLARPNMILNTIIADELQNIAGQLEREENTEEAVTRIICDIYKKHKRIIFNGDGYSGTWLEEAARRGLPCYRKSVDVFPELMAEKNVRVFERQHVLNRNELLARCRIYLENYIMKNMIEANTMISMAEREIRPAFLRYQEKLARTAVSLQELKAETTLHRELLDESIQKLTCFNARIGELKAEVGKAEEIEDYQRRARFVGDEITEKMEALRDAGDELEKICAAEDWPFPGYAEMLFKI
ncbi:MAG: glutamine synthetase III [Candidatus Marinimicrobia bacterium]|nr:glutamine synthetase III [Candidatus Neomarinimicrobiota bacterium]